MCTNTWRESLKREPDSFQWCPVTGIEAMSLTQNTEASDELQETLSYWGWLIPGTDFPEWPWVTSSSCPCLSRMLSQLVPKRHLPTSAFLWSCDSVISEDIFGFKFEVEPQINKSISKLTYVSLNTELLLELNNQSWLLHYPDRG